jgi:hypothetical protein
MVLFLFLVLVLVLVLVLGQDQVQDQVQDQDQGQGQGQSTKLHVSYLFVILEKLLVFCFPIDGDQSTFGDVDQPVSVDRISWLVRRLADGVVILF